MTDEFGYLISVLPTEAPVKVDVATFPKKARYPKEAKLLVTVKLSAEAEIDAVDIKNEIITDLEFEPMSGIIEVKVEILSKEFVQ